MKLHSIFGKTYLIWWGILAIASSIRFLVVGLPQMKGYERYGVFFWVIATLVSALIFSSIPYLIYRLISGKWNNKVFMILISIMTILLLFTL